MTIVFLGASGQNMIVLTPAKLIYKDLRLKDLLLGVIDFVSGKNGKTLVRLNLPLTPSCQFSRGNFYHNFLSFHRHWFTEDCVGGGDTNGRPTTIET